MTDYAGHTLKAVILSIPGPEWFTDVHQNELALSPSPGGAAENSPGEATIAAHSWERSQTNDSSPGGATEQPPATYFRRSERAPASQCTFIPSLWGSASQLTVILRARRPEHFLGVPKERLVLFGAELGGGKRRICGCASNQPPILLARQRIDRNHKKRGGTPLLVPNLRTNHQEPLAPASGPRRAK